jgi:hypothetical protein
LLVDDSKSTQYFDGLEAKLFITICCDLAIVTHDDTMHK